MKISLLTDAPRHNLALMKLSAYHKSIGDNVSLNEPIFQSDYRYASILFEHNINKFIADEYGGPAFVQRRRVATIHARATMALPMDVDKIQPDYNLFNTDYSLGYTFRPCFNTCDFCKVPILNHPTTGHHSIWEFHDKKFKKICLLNNNTFQDQQWKDTFKEIWEEGLSVIDENGYDLRLLDDEKADALHRTKWSTPLHFAWDRMVDEGLIINGLKLINKHKLRSTSNGVYVLIGYNTTEKEDIYRCQIIHDYGLTPYPMPFVKNRYTKRFKRFINLHYYRSYKTIEKAWLDYLKL